MTTGDTNDIQNRLKAVRPKGWWAWTAPIFDAVAGGLSDVAAWCYNWIGYAKAQTRLSTVYGVWLDVFSYDFLGLNLPRQGLQDDAFRAVLQSTILQERVTRAGMISVLTKLTGKAPNVFEPWNTYDTGAYSNKGAGQVCGQFGYGAGQGGYGSMNLPAQAFMQVHRTGPAGVPNAAGYTDNPGGYGQGSIEYIGPTTEVNGITNQMIENAINVTKPTGTRMWILFD